jgi:hypothetical protein
MDRSRLIELAPQYYKIAICNFMLTSAPNIASSNTLWDSLPRNTNAPVFWRVLRELVDSKILDAIPDDFGPTLYRVTPNLRPTFETMQKVEGTPAHRWSMDPQRMVWLAAALQRVNSALEEQKIKNEDFQKPDAEWEPLPIERSDPKLQKVTAELDKTIEAVEADNGYSATYPEEKAFVADSLKAATEKLKRDNSISYAYLKRKAIDALDILIRRFGPASVGLIAQAARAALFDWLKSAGGKLLHWLVS